MGKVLKNAQLVDGAEEVDIFALLHDTNRQSSASNREEPDNVDTVGDEVTDVEEYDEGDGDYDEGDGEGEIVDVEEYDEDNYDDEITDVDEYDEDDDYVEGDEDDANGEDDDNDGNYVEPEVEDVDDGEDDDNDNNYEPEVEDVDDGEDDDEDDGWSADEDDVDGSDDEDSQQDDSEPSTVSIEQLRGMINTAQHKNSSEKVVNEMSDNVQQSTNNIKRNEVEVSEKRKQLLSNTQLVKLYLSGRTKKQTKETLVGIFTLFSALIEYLKWYELSDLQADIQNVEQEIVDRDNAIDTYTDDAEILRCVRERKEFKAYKQELQQLIKYMGIATDNDLYDIIEEVINALKEG